MNVVNHKAITIGILLLEYHREESIKIFIDKSVYVSRKPVSEREICGDQTFKVFFCCFLFC